MTPLKLPTLTGSLTAAALGLLLLAPPASATWSILAWDGRTQQIGAALATCLARDEIAQSVSTAALVDNSFHAVPCRGGLVAQGFWYLGDGPDVATTAGAPLLEEVDDNAPFLLESLTDPSLDGRSWEFPGRIANESFSTQSYKVRQYGVVQATSTASYSGEDLVELWDFFGFENSEVAQDSRLVLDNSTDERETKIRYRVSVQGNVVAPGTVNATLNAFLNSASATSQAGGSDCMELPALLLDALSAGREAGGGDVRCDNETFGYLRVVGPNGVLEIDLSAHYFSTDDQAGGVIAEMQQELDLWLNDEACGSFTEPNICEETLSPTPSPTTASKSNSLSTLSQRILLVECSVVLLYML